MKNPSRWLAAACLLVLVANSGCATGPWFNQNPAPGAVGAPPRRGLFPNMRNRLREMMPGATAPQPDPQATGEFRPGPTAEAVSITVGDE